CLPRAPPPPSPPPSPYTTLFRSQRDHHHDEQRQARGRDALGYRVALTHRPRHVRLLSRQVEVAVSAIDCERDEEGHGHHGDERRSEEHTSELQSRFDLVCRLLLE